MHYNKHFNREIKRISMKQWRKWAWDQLSTSQHKHDKRISSFNILIIILVLVMLVIIAVRSISNIPPFWDNLLFAIQFFLWVFFVIEWLLRFWTCIEDPSLKDKKYPRLKWLLRPTSWLDFIAIMPLAVLFISEHNGLVFELRLIRVFLLIRLFRFIRNSRPIYYLTELFRRQWKELGLSISLIIGLTYILATLLWLVEKDVNTGLSSIPEAFWWAAISITSVGYGDVVPVTAVGKLIASSFLLLSMAFLALPGAVMAAGFMELLREENIKKERRRHSVSNSKNK